MNPAGKSLQYLHEHPACASALGMGPVIAQSASVLTAVTIGMVFAAVLFLSAVTVSLVRNLIPHTYRLAFILPVTALWVSTADLLLQAWAYEIRTSLDIYIPLLAMNSLVLMLLERQAPREPLFSAAKTAVFSAAGLVIITVLTGTLRELLAQGALLTESAALLLSVPVFPKMPFFGAAAGGFIVLGCVIALINFGCDRFVKSVQTG